MPAAEVSPLARRNRARKAGAQEEPAGHDHEDFAPWWLREIVPAYHQAGIAGLAIVIGDPNAPGETDDVPPGVRFKRGYFSDLHAALSWQLA